jgi:hypothetical protein
MYSSINQGLNMPYISQEDRKWFDGLHACFSKNPPANAGELNYLFTLLAHYYLDGKIADGKYEANYQAMNDVLGALEGCKLELYRRRVAPYEDIKIRENGDVYINSHLKSTA